MPLQSGVRLGPYEILSQSGAGGMGEVYRAKDVRLQRIVAIKVLPELFSTEPERRERFEREARAISKLAHPHICVLHDIGHQDGIDYLVMEYLEGETLAKRLIKGALPIDEALKHAVEIADALDKAHRQGIVHRDLKPGNIMLTESGAKLLDFGLAKLRSEAGEAGLSSLATKDPTLTAEGAIVGTLQYMAPEQLEGKEADPRTDIFAFGTVLYEMLTGKRAFEGETQASLIAAILERDPPAVSALTPLCPRFLEHVVRRCLAKKPERRYQDIYDVRIDLEELLVETAQPAPGGHAVAIGSTRWRQWLPWALTAVLFVMFAVVAWKYFRMTPPAQQATTRFSVATQPLAVFHAPSPAVALSPDGTHLAYVAGDSPIGQLYLRKLNSLEARPIAGADQTSGPFFSPDGQWVAFFGSGLQKISLRGGFPVNVCVLSAITHGGSWGDDGSIVFQSGVSLWRVSAEGGTPKRISTPDRLFLFPEILPGSKAVIVTAVKEAQAQAPGVWVLPLEAGQPRLLVEGGGLARYMRSGHLVYAREGSLLAAPFDLESLQLTGPAVPVIRDDMMMGLPGEPSMAHFAVSNTGTLAYLPGSLLSDLKTLVWVNRKGREEALPMEPRRYDWPRLSPDGSRLAVDILEPGNHDVWIYELARRTLSRLTFDPADDGRPLWTPDGQRVIFRSLRDGPGKFNLFWTAADGTGQAERLTTSPNIERTAHSFSPDGKRLVFSERNPESSYDLHMLLLEGQPTSKPLLQTPFSEGSPAISPDGRWVAYRSTETGRFEIYVRPFPDVHSGKWQISSNDGSSAVWSPKGRELFYQQGEAMMVVAVETAGSSLRSGAPKLLFTGKYVLGPARNFDIAPDGRRFIMIKETGQTLNPSARDELTVIPQLVRRTSTARPCKKVRSITYLTPPPTITSC